MAKVQQKGAKQVKNKYRPSKPQGVKKDLSKLRVSKAARKPFIYREKTGCKGLVLGQAPPGPRETLPRGWRPLAGPAEQRLGRLAGLSVAQLWKRFDRANLLAWYPGLKKRSKKHDVSKGYKLHTSDGDIFPMEQARLAAASLDLSKYSSVLLLGASVAKAFGLKGRLFEVEKRGRTRLVTFPHPSGVSHFWNDEENRQKALKAFKAEMKAMGKKWEVLRKWEGWVAVLQTLLIDEQNNKSGEKGVKWRAVSGVRR